MAVLMFWQLNFMTSLWCYLRSAPLAWPQCFPLLARLSFFSFFLTRRENDLSANLNSLHFYSIEWTNSTKVDIIFSGFDWPPACPTMTSCPPPTAGCWMLDRQGYGGQDLASARLAGVNECGQRWRRFVVNSPGKQWGRAHPTPDTPAAAGTFTWAVHMNTFVASQFLVSHECVACNFWGGE